MNAVVDLSRALKFFRHADEQSKGQKAYETSDEIERRVEDQIPAYGRQQQMLIVIEIFQWTFTK